MYTEREIANVSDNRFFTLEQTRVFMADAAAFIDAFYMLR